MKEEPTIIELLNEIEIIGQEMQDKHNIQPFDYEDFGDLCESIFRPTYPVRIYEI